MAPPAAGIAITSSLQMVQRRNSSHSHPGAGHLAIALLPPTQPII
ncbi:hypothetical protein [Tolypothrix sp. VBCCA 56010]